MSDRRQRLRKKGADGFEVPMPRDARNPRTAPPAPPPPFDPAAELAAAPAAAAANVFHSPISFEAQRIGAVALYCSDGRFGDAIDQLLHEGLALPRYDRLAVPGGPACLSGHLAVFWEDLGTSKQIEFLVRVHQIGRVVLIAHHGCAFYRLHLNVRDQDLVTRQMRDLSGAARRIARLAPRVTTEAYFARPAADGGIDFAPVAL